MMCKIWSGNSNAVFTKVELDRGDGFMNMKQILHAGGTGRNSTLKQALLKKK